MLKLLEISKITTDHKISIPGLPVSCAFAVTEVGYDEETGDWWVECSRGQTYTNSDSEHKMWVYKKE